MLKGVSLGTSGLVLAPLAGQLAAHAAGTSGKTQRFVFVVKSSGLTPADVVPKAFDAELTTKGKSIKAGDNYTTGNQLKHATKLINRSLVHLELHDSMKSLEPFRDKLMILQGLSGQMVNGGHTSGYGAMSCMRGNGGSNGSGKPVAETIDSMMARAFPSPFNHVGFAMMTRTMGGNIADSVCYPGISAAGANKPLPFQGSPTQAYRSLFGSVAGGSAKKKFDLRSKVLDFMADDVRRLEKSVGASEREKLAFHIEAIEDMQRRREALAKMGPQLKAAAPQYDEELYASMAIGDRLARHFDLAAGAIIAGLTNVVTIRPDALGTKYVDLLGEAGSGVHGIGHGNSPEGVTPDEARSKIRKLHIDQIAKLAAKLKAVPEGDGTMLDNTTIIYTSEVGDKHHATNIQWPFIVLGDVGGKLNTAGRYVQYPGKAHGGVAPGHHTIANWWMSLLHAVGKPTDDFGQKDNKVPGEAQKGPLAELIT